MKYTYLLEINNIQKELDDLWERYQSIITDKDANWEEFNEARAIIYLTGQIYCEQIAIEAIKRRLHLLKQPIQLLEFFYLVDSNSERLKDLRKEGIFVKLEEFYKIIKKYKNKYLGGKFYLDEEKFIGLYNKLSLDKNLKIGYKGEFDDKNLSFMS